MAQYSGRELLRSKVMKIIRNLKDYIKKDFPYFHFDYKEHYLDNSPSTRKRFLEVVYKTADFKFYALKKECKIIIKPLLFKIDFYLTKLFKIRGEIK
jgi:hypothetical protein